MHAESGMMYAASVAASKETAGSRRPAEETEPSSGELRFSKRVVHIPAGEARGLGRSMPIPARVSADPWGNLPPRASLMGNTADAAGVDPLPSQ